VAKAEWGTKRICLSCGARFYDLQRDPIVCPSCGTNLDPVAQAKPRRSRAVAKAAAPVAVAAVEASNTADDDSDDDEDDSDSAIEDVSELGDDDVGDVIETDMDDDDSER
jgi:uncharacterized protein (TIGR02300 family)